MKRTAESRDRSTRLSASIPYARIRGAASNPEAIRILKAILADATKYGFLGYELEARLALGELEARAGASKTSNNLKAVEKDASNAGFGLIERKAAPDCHGQFKPEVTWRCVQNPDLQGI
jgi:hypothetical protein